MGDIRRFYRNKEGKIIEFFFQTVGSIKEKNRLD